MSRKKGTVTAAARSQYGYFVQLQETDDFYYNTKFEPPCGVGDVVGIAYEDKGKGRGNVTKIKLLESNGPGFQKKAPAKREGAGGGGGYNDPARQDSIIFQSSRKDALVFIDLLLRNEAFAIKGKADAKAVQISELLTKVTAKFFADAADPRNSEVLKGAEEDAKEENEWEDGGEEAAGKDEWDGEEDWDD
ncbi:hypothetical protein LCGC14_0808330 [marine sediment metagenome]|uniref:Uncharacterized protein n=1 Tax=marine sediment metagenome TaxID=412755 RepID=A0A0F9S7I0_9ZZZZ